MGRPALPSIVAERDDVITGFLGVMPLPIRFDGRPVRLAIGGNLMVDPDERDPMVAMRILRRYFAGAQDVSFTDTATPQAVRLWAARWRGGALPFDAVAHPAPTRLVGDGGNAA